MSALNESPEVKAAREASVILSRGTCRERVVVDGVNLYGEHVRMGVACVRCAGHDGEHDDLTPDFAIEDVAVHLRAVLAALDEAMETLANERGEGEGPTPEWRYDDGLLRWSLPLCDYRVTFREHGRWDIERLDGRYWDEDPCRVIDNRPTAREAMREAMRLDAADAALRSAP